MKAAVVLSFCGLLAMPAVVPAERGPGPVTQPAAAEVMIERLSAGRRLIQLPATEFPLRLAPACAAGLEFDSLSIGVADTRRAFGAAEFGTETVLETSLRIPGRQIGPVAVDNFCVTAAESPATMSIVDALTANISVRCSNESEQAVNYDTLALEIRLVCRPQDEPVAADPESTAAQPADQDQESPSLTRF